MCSWGTERRQVVVHQFDNGHGSVVSLAVGHPKYSGVASLPIVVAISESSEYLGNQWALLRVCICACVTAVDCGRLTYPHPSPRLALRILRAFLSKCNHLHKAQDASKGRMQVV